MKRKLFTLLTLALCAVFALSACSLPFDLPFDLPGFSSSSSEQSLAPSEEDYTPQGLGSRRTIAFGQMEYTRPDIEAFTQSMEERTAQLAEAKDFDEVMRLDEQVETLFEDFDTMHTLAWLHSKLDVNDSFYEEEVRLLDEASVDQGLLLNDFNRQLVEGPFAEEYRAEVGDYMFEAIEASLLFTSPTVQDFKKERAALETDYDQALSTLTVTYEGTSYTLEEIGTVDSETLYYTLVDMFYQEHAGSFAQMYARMIELDKQTARELGFNEPAKMYYLSYSRDYTTDEAQELIANVKSTFVPLLDQVFQSYYDPGSFELEDALTITPSAVANVSEELREAWDFMLEYGLYDCEGRIGKNAGNQFTTTIPGYDAPYLYTYWRGDFSSASTIIHEFGHFYDFWLHYDVPIVSNLDISEVYSQGLELLMHPYLDEYTEYGDDARNKSLQDFLLSALIYQSLLEEFQFRAYELDTFDARVIGRLFADLLEEYGLYANRDAYGADNSWLEIPHVFLSPFYTISYVTSAVAALQIWAISQDDWRAGADTYLTMMRADQNQPFTDLLAVAGLKPVHQLNVLEDIAGHYTRVFPTQQGRRKAA